MFSTSTTTKISVFSFVVIFFAYYYKQRTDIILQEKLQGTLLGLLRAEEKAVLVREPKIAVGFGSCQDVVVQSSDVINDLNPPEEPEHFESIDTLERLLKVFAFFFKHGAAAERYINNSTLLNQLVEISEHAESSRWTIGGNAPVMASRFAKEGCQVLLGAQMSSKLRRELPEGVLVSGPEVNNDDVHLLLEYPAGMEWGPYTAPRANRLIIHNDIQNPLLSSLEIFSQDLKEFKPDLLVIGGLQMMDNFPFPDENVREQRLSQVKDLLVSQPTSTLIHFEMASFTEELLFQQLLNHIVPHCDSLGMNEQELPNLYNLMDSGNITLISESYPRIATVLDQMRDVFSIVQKLKNNKNVNRKLTRLHVHTLAFQAIMTLKTSTWKNSMSAAAKAALTAHRHTCGSNKINTEKAKLIMDDSFTTSREGKKAKRIHFDSQRPVACWDEDEYQICVAPVLVCTKVVQTGGGGDNISSAGLVLQV